VIADLEALRGRHKNQASELFEKLQAFAEALDGQRTEDQRYFDKKSIILKVYVCVCVCECACNLYIYDKVLVCGMCVCV